MGGRGSYSGRSGGAIGGGGFPRGGGATPMSGGSGSSQNHITRDEMDNMTDAEFMNGYVRNNSYGGSRSQEMISKGLNGASATQILVDDLGMHDKPQVLDDDAFDKLVASNPNMHHMHRGVHTAASRNNTMYADTTYIGGGIWGDGLYFSNQKRTAAGYSGISGSANKMTATLDPKKTKSIAFSTIDAKLRAQGISAQTEDYSCWAIKHGYNCITRPGYNAGERFIIPLDRSIIIFRKNSLVH